MKLTSMSNSLLDSAFPLALHSFQQLEVLHSFQILTNQPTRTNHTLMYVLCDFELVLILLLYSGCPSFLRKKTPHTQLARLTEMTKWGPHSLLDNWD